MMPRSLDLLISDILREAHNDGEKERLRTLRDLDGTLQLWDALHSADTTIDAAAVRTQTYTQIPVRVLEAGGRWKPLARPR